MLEFMPTYGEATVKLMCVKLVLTITSVENTTNLVQFIPVTHNCE